MNATARYPLICSLVACVSLSASAAQVMEDGHVLSLSAGVAAPSMTTALNENPAGLVYNFQPKLLVDAHNDDSKIKEATVGASLFGGNRSMGGGLGVSRDLSTDRTAVRAGLALDMRGMGLSVGGSGSYRVAGPKSGDELDANAGILINPYGNFRLGLTAFDVTSQVQAVGAGFALEVSKGATFALDTTSDRSLNGLAMKPALSVRSREIQLSYGYGFQIDQEQGPRSMRMKSTVGIALNLSRSAVFEFYYNHVSKYYLGAVLRF